MRGAFMTLWSSTIARMPRLDAAEPQRSGRGRPSMAFPACNIQGGLCDTLVAAIPLCILGVQFIRDDKDVVQDGLIIFANAHADRVFGAGQRLCGMRLLNACQEILLAGLWQRCLWVAAHGRGETIVEQAGGEPRYLTIAPYEDGLILCRSIESATLASASMADEVATVG
jgi:hypothetical protein